jgi:hypothetical protein
VKKTATIIILGILLFNWCGYQVLTAYLENKANNQLQIKLDDNKYDPSELISIKVPVQEMSYYNSSTQFERVDGLIDIGGQQYNYVKRRLYNDSIEILCIPNRMAMHLKSAKNDFFKLVNDIQRPGQDKKADTHSYKSFSGEYCSVHNLFNISNHSLSIRKDFFYYTAMLPFHSPLTVEHPPQKIA